MGDRILTPTAFGNVHQKSNKTIFGHLVKTIPRATRKLARTYLKTAAAPSLKRQANHVSQMAHKPICMCVWVCAVWGKLYWLCTDEWSNLLPPDATAPRAVMQCVLKQGSNGGVKQFDTGISAFDRNRGWGGVKKERLDRGQKLKIVKSRPDGPASKNDSFLY